ncbi:Nudix family hydrolase [Nitrosomonas sp. Nm166]|uniref:Nudix family hydrolase n=1 Tax=Nitrosomonas sp. Nm166 TaxID=1881054 RepID=UPI0008E3DB47|nr:Nudix family hydrolase [Nitrosomonas sp. Nm166]SFE42910.1 8-oxo-dGTP diphosphatase [Nitrosomonas sp. Nm166]
MPIIEVVAAVIMRPNGQFLLTRRPKGKIYSGYWEFPGGKVENNESLLQALERELWEELGIQIRHPYPWITRVFSYSHATVRLHFFRVVEWEGRVAPQEKQGLFWQWPHQIAVSPVLPANGPILQALLLPPLYAITQAAEIGIEPALKQIEQALQNGLRLLQIREKQMAKDLLREFSRQILALAHDYQARVLINSDMALVREIGADGVHLTSSQLMALSSRPDPEYGLCGASCHNTEELFAAQQLGLDFVVLSPVQPTLSHPELFPLGWRKFAALIRDYPLPVYALGGLRLEDLQIAQGMGAHGIALMRGIVNP